MATLHKNRYRRFYITNGILLLIGSATMLAPVLHIIAQSFSSSTAILSGRVTIFPIGFTTVAYRQLISGTPVVRSFMNSVHITIIGTAINLFFSILAAYPLSRPYFYGRRFFSLALVFTMLFGGGLIPSFLLVRGLGLTNTYFSIWLPGLISVYLIMILRTYFEGIPKSLDEASRIDGATETQLLLRVYLPLAIPALAALTLFYAVQNWNVFRQVLLYINDTAKQNLNVLVRTLIRSQLVLEEATQVDPGQQMELSAPESVRAAGIVVLVLPVMMIYPFLQKHFVKGVLLGSIKG
jgi:putative aldouronate transport system permease protein